MYKDGLVGEIDEEINKEMDLTKDPSIVFYIGHIPIKGVFTYLCPKEERIYYDITFEPLLKKIINQ